ncbi:T9SS type B sorting domain-containing protein [Flavobacterium sp. CSZ]|uniref:T9SS type B sorting domain-containing protein n=1 Tax=Flavobacterium sp. CSZ TaxID=2783791 RepID=UPI00188B11FD|nr:T9SS type B sorting domain-containing protein [Flavobacterium sp. CSZ]MBF4487922.1 T9SS type B sorting domain-containing protein [Flavobacterium sp. CSZ]
MKKPTIFKVFIAAVLVLLSISSHAQLRKGFTPRKTTSLNGDILVIGNNILNRDNGNGERPKDPYDVIGEDSKLNDDFTMKYIDIDNNTDTYNSSSAKLTIPQASKTCYEIVYAALYWGGTYRGTDRSKINQVKFKSPTAAYKTITGELLFDEGGAGVSNPYVAKPYACFKEITNEVIAAKEGDYTVGDIVCTEGKFAPGASAAGWSIFIIYKDPLLPNKYITSFDGFSIIRSSDGPLDIPISGFRTNPFGDVNVKLAFSALEGDNPLEGDGLEIKGAKSAAFGAISSLVRPIRVTTGRNPKSIPNFFNSSISDGDTYMMDRNPKSINTLGYDAGVVKIDNKNNSIIQNDETNATLRISTSSDSYYMFFNALAVEIIAPKIVLRKNVLDKDNKNINGKPVTLSQDLQYEINFRNEGNDDAKNFTITDNLPKNVIFGGLNSITMDSRITAAYDPVARRLVFTIPDALVVANGPLIPYSIKFKVKVVDDCNELIDACANKIENIAFSKYYGVKNTTPEGFGEGSYSTISECNVGEPTATNFLVGIDKCLFSRDVSLCGTTTLTAALGYNTYVWKDPNGVVFGGNNRTVTINKPGKYTVDNSGAANCEPIQQTFNVTDYLASTIKNPIKGDNIDPATGEAFTCVRDKKPFPKIFLCGLNDKRDIDTQITGATKVTWQETTDVPSKDEPNPESCPYEGATNWTTIVENSTKFTADRPGVFRVVVNYGNTCVVTHYFNVYQNKLDSKAEKQDIICNTKGWIKVTNPPENTGYNYSLDGVNYQPESTFYNVPKGSYKVQIRQTVLIDGQISACPFFVDVNVEELEFKTDLKATNPICTGDLGTITATISNVPGNYKFILRKKGTTAEIQNTGLITDNYKVFTGVEPGFVYEVIMSTANNGCSVIKEVEVFDYRLTAEAKVTKTLSECGAGEILVTVKGGTPRPGPPPYYMYYINGNVNYVTNPKIVVTAETLPADGIFNIEVVDDKGCKVMALPVKMVMVPKPTITVTPSNVDCYGTNGGQIKIDVSPADSGYAVSYSLNNGAFNSISPITNLAPGSYSLVVKYVYEGAECLDEPRIIKITGPENALSASAGVSELAGCGLPGFEHQGKIRITNVQGGTPLYTYSFDDQKTWINENEAFVDPGKYTVYVKDSKDCVYAMKDIVLDPKPADPSIEPNPKVVYNCNGTGNATIVVNNTGGANYTYEYYIDTKPNTPITSNVFNNVPVGKHVISVKYKAVSAATYSNLLQEDFGQGGYTTTPGISPKYCFEDETTPHPATFPSICGNINDYQINDGKYAVASSIKTTFGGTWVVAKDHTLPADKFGRFLCVNIGSSAGVGGIIYSKPIKDVIVDQPVIISLWAENLMKSTTGSNYYDPELTIQLVNDLGGPGETIVATTDTANPWKVPRNEIWNYKELSLNPGAYNNLSFVIRSYNNKFSGNDLLVDDIWVRQLPKSCITEKKFDVIIETNKAFKVSEPVIDNATCSDKNDGKITLTVENFDAKDGFKYSLDNGGTWNTATTSPFTISGLAKGNYKIIVKNDDAGLCQSSFEKEITAPTTITTTASVTKPSTCILGASITAIPVGGSPKYTYELYHANGTIYRTSDKATFDDVPEGSYFVVVKDKNSCASSASDPVEVKDPTKPKITLDESSDLCYDAANKATIVVKVEGGIAPFYYSLNGATAQKDNNKFEVGPGTYSVVVTDGNGCIADAITGIQIGKQIIASPRITKLIDCTLTPEAEITIVASEGIAPYTYKVSEDGGTTFADMTSNIYKTSKVGSYVFKVTDSKGCSVVTAAAKVDTKLTPTASIASQTNPKCNNDSNGSFTVLPAGGSGPTYQFKFNGGSYGTSATYSNLNAFVGAVNTRKYTYQVKDSKGCESIVYEVTLTNPTKVAVKGSFPANTTCSTSTVITIIGEGGAGGYKYNFDGGTSYNDVTTKTVTNTTSEQTIKFYVKDANGCTAENEIKVPAFNPPTLINFSVPAAITCNKNNTSLTLTTTGGIAPITYEVTGGPTSPPSNTTGIFTGLVAGEYSFKATDARGCSVNDKKTIDQAVKIKAEGSKVDEVCYDAKNGKASFTVSDISSTGNFSYTFSPNTGTPNVNGNVVTYTNLAPGTYTFVATDLATGCSSDSKQVTVGTATAINFTVNASKISCNNKFATLTITGISGGSGNYTYAYAKSPSTAPSTPYGTILTVDTAVLTTSIDVYVKDVNNCAVKKTIAILTEDLPTINPIAAQCYPGSPVSVTITGTFATPATFSKNGTDFGDSATFSLTPGNYKLTVKDKFGCEAFINYKVADQLTITPTVVPDVSCTTETKISLTSAGGTGTHTYAVSTDGGNTYATTTSPYTATASGTYRFRVSDSATPVCYAYTVDIPVTLKPIVLTLSTGKTNVKCNGGATGSISITATSGKAPFTYSVTKGGVAASVTVSATTTSASATGLSAGIYDIVLKDILGCEGTAQVTIAEPTKLVASASATKFSCNAANTKQSALVTINPVTTGTGPDYQYSFNGGSFTGTNTFPVTDNGSDQTIKYIVMDSNGCTTPEQSITLLKLNPPQVLSVSASPIYCAPAVTSSDVSIKIKPLTGVAPLKYEIFSGPTTTNTSGAADGNFKGLPAGNYVFKITDDNGCYVYANKTIQNVVPMTAIATKVNDAYCHNGATGNISYEVNGFVSTYSYTVNGVSTVSGQTANTFTLPNLAAGVYKVDFIDETSLCTVSTSITITEPIADLTLGLVSNVNANCGKPSSTVTVLGAGGTQNATPTKYEYAILDADNPTGTPLYGPSPIFNINSNGGADKNWTIFVKDAKGCTATLPVTIDTDPIPTVSASVTNQCSASGSSFTIKATGNGGVGPYTYTINTGVAPSPADTFTVAAGNYTITVTDANNCTNITSVVVSDALNPLAVLTNDICPAVLPALPTPAKITFTINGGKSPYGYRVKVGAGSYSGLPIAFTTPPFEYQTLTPGVYQFEISDANGCTKETNPITVTNVGVTSSYDPISPTCNGDTDGSVTIKALTGVAPFTYNFNNKGFSNITVYGGLAAGTYPYRVKDSRGCVQNGTIVIAPTPKIDVKIGVNGITCNSTQPGSLDLSVLSGGTAPYTYYVYDNKMNQVPGSPFTETSNAPTAVINVPNLAFGDYYVTVVDSKGCKFESTALRIAPPPYLEFGVEVIGKTCADGISIEIKVKPLTGTPNFTYSIYGTSTTSGSIPDYSYIFKNLDQNTHYIFEVIDSKGCPTYLDYTTPTISPITITAKTTDVTCFGSANGKIDFEVTGYDGLVTQIDYELRDNLTNQPVPPGNISGPLTYKATPAPHFEGAITSLKPGNYTLYVKEVDGTQCSTSFVFQIKQPASALQAKISKVLNANCHRGALVTITAGGGTGPFKYVAYPTGDPVPAFVDENVLELDPAKGNDWSFIVRDAKGCEVPLGQIITTDPSPLLDPLTIVNKCVAENTFGIIVSGVKGTGAPVTGAVSISVDSDNAYTSISTWPYTVTGLSSGLHTIYIKDANDCIDSKTVTIAKPLSLTIDPVIQPSCIVNDGSVTLNPKGGSGTYSYTISPTYIGQVISGNTITGLKAGTHTVTITDGGAAGTQCTTTAEFTLKVGTPVDFDVEITNILCSSFNVGDLVDNDNSGKLVVVLKPGSDNPNYTYTLTGTETFGNVAVSRPAQPTPEFTNLKAGVYDILVTSGKGCFLKKTNFTITKPTKLTTTAKVTEFTCNPSTNIVQAVVVTIDVPTTGTSPYQYNFDGSSTYNDDNKLTVYNNTVPLVGRDISYYVIDKNGCKFTGTVHVDPYKELTDIKFVATAPVCPTNVSDVTLNVIGGYTTAASGNTLMAKYEIISPFTLNNGPSNVFPGLAPGTYTFRATDDHGCSIERDLIIDDVVPIDIKLTSSTNITCNAANGLTNNGKAIFQVSDFSASGNYTIAVTSVPPSVPAVVVPTPVADVITLQNLQAGTHTITVTDNTTNCSKSAVVTITVPNPITFTASATNVNCNLEESTITVANVAGGTGLIGNYTYAAVPALSGTTPSFGSNPIKVDTNLTILSWDVYVKDANGCISAKVNVPVIRDAAPVLNQPAQQCFVDAAITINFAAPAISTTYNGNKTFTVNGLPTTNNITFTKAGKYKIVLTDDHGCTDEIEYIIEERLIANATLEKDLYCEVGNEAAKIVVEVKGGKTTPAPNYTYQMYLDGTPVNGPKPTTGNFTEFVTAEGDYTFLISDSNVPCTFTTAAVTVKKPGTIVLTPSKTDVICWNESNGSLTVVPSGGVAPYKFVLSGATNTTGDKSGIYTSLAQGDYTVTVTDAKGCSTTSANITITQPPLLEADHSVTPNTSCSTFTEIVVEGKGGTGTGTYQYNFDGKGYDSVDRISVSNDGSIASVTYTVRDANGCETSPVTVPIVPLNKPSALTFSPTAITCAAVNSNVTVKATNGVGALEFKIIEFNGVPTTLYAPITTSGSAVPAVFSGLPFGDYKFEVTDNNKCSFSDVLTIKDVVRIIVDGESFAKTCIGNNDGKAIFTVSNFKGTYTYTITKDTDAPSAPVTTSNAVVTLSNLATGSYKIDILDDITSCPTTFTVVINDPVVVTVTEEDNDNANCTTGALVTVAGHGGTPDYTYSFVPVSPTATPGVFLPDATRELDPATPAWYVYAKDQNGCISVPIIVNIQKDPLPAGFTASVTSQCADALGNYEIVIDDSAAVGVGPFTYSVGDGFQSGLKFSVKAAKTYDIVVRDKFGCETTFPALITILQPVILEVKKDIYPTCADGDGQVTASATGGSGNFSFTIDGVRTITGTPAVFDKLFAGSHTIIVTDLGTPSNCTDEVVFVLDAATKVTGFDAIPTMVSCNGGNDGTITASLAPTSPGVNDNPKYMYSLNGGTPQESPVFKGLIAGTYTVSVLSGRGCPADKTVEVKQPLEIKVPNPVVTPYGCTTDNISNYATITVNGVTGGTGEYTYEFINGVTQVYKGPRNVFIEKDYKGGSYTINVYDENECIGTAVGTYEIVPFTAMDNVVIKVDNAITCVDNEDITVTVKSVTGAVITGLNYSLSGTNGTVYGPTPSTDGIFTDLGIGNYIVTVTNPATNCTIQAVHFINNPNTFDIIAKPENENICFGTTTRVQLTFVDNQLIPDNDAGPFEYTITGGVLPITGTTTSAGPIWVDNLAAGQYKIVAKLVNKPECTVETTFTINQPTAALTVTKTQSEITCIKDNNDGVIVATATGGWPGEYLYELRSGTTIIKAYSDSPIFDKLTAGDYRIYAKDALGCESFVDAKLENPTPISITISATPMLTCFDNEDGVITINTINGGSGNYSYTLHGVLTDGTVTVEQSQGGNQFRGLKAGTYYVTVNDTWTCTSDSNKVTIDQPEIVKANLEIQKTESCKQVPVVRLTATGGNAPYYYSADGINYTGPFNSFVDITLPVTTAKTEYKYFVKDANDCKSYVSNTSEFSPVPALGFERSSEIDIKCKGGATGSISVLANGGLGNYVYTLQNAAGVDITPAPAQVIPGTFTQLPIGTYIVKITSLDCDTVSTLFELTEPDTSLTADAIATPLTCNGYNNGKITVNATGGVGAYKYAIEPEFKQFFDKNVFENLKPGFYDVLVQDENECYVFLKDVEVKEPAPLSAVEIPNSMIPEVCVGDKNGVFAIQIIGGTAPYTASLDNDKGPFLPVDGDTEDYNGLSGGKHIVYIIDNSGCMTEVTIDMPEPVMLDPTVEVNYDCVNNSQSNMVTVTVDESNTDLTQVDYALDSDVGPFQPGNIFTNVAPGKHFIVARHTNGCKVPTASFDIKAYDPLTLIKTPGQEEMNILSVTAAGGAPGYEYSFNGEPFTSSNKYKYYKTADYVVIVRDRNGCTATITLPGIYTDVCLDNYFTPGGATNTTWGPGCTNIYNNLEFSIFDRYGRVIAKYHYGQKWDGRYNGAELPSGDYWYVLKLNDAKDDREFVGHFTLYR